MSDQDDEPKAIPTDEETLHRLAVADLLDLEAASSPREEGRDVAYLRLHLLKGFHNSYPVLAADRDGLVENLRRLLAKLDPK